MPSHDIESLPKELRGIRFLLWVFIVGSLIYLLNGLLGLFVGGLLNTMDDKPITGLDFYSRLFAYGILTLFMPLKMLCLIKKQEVDVPEKLVTLFEWLILMELLIWIFNLLVLDNIHPTASGMAGDIFLSLFFYLSITAKLRFSQSVYEYYGSTARRSQVAAINKLSIKVLELQNAKLISEAK